MLNTQMEFLKQLGVDQWLPRHSVAGAAESPQWVYRLIHPADLLEEEETFSESELIQEPSKPAHRHPAKEPHAELRAIAQIQHALQEPDAEPMSRPVRTEGVRPDKSRSTLIAPPRFRIALTRSERTLFVDQLPVQGHLGFSQQHSRLLAGILRSLGEDPRSLSLPTILQWPLLAGKTLDQGPEEAYKNVQRQLEWMLKEAKVKQIVLFGEDLSRWVIRLDEQEQSYKGEHPRWHLPYLTTVTLTQALQLPELKRQIWLDIQSLIVRENSIGG